MANQFVNLPAPAANGSGAAVDTSTYGGPKTFTVSQPTFPLPCSVIIEFSNEEAPENWAPLFQLSSGTRDFVIAARWMRATVTNYRGGGAPTVNVGGDDSGADFVELVATAGDGDGASVDTEALPDLKTLHVADDFRGALNIEISEDAGTSWAVLTTFYAPGYKTLEFTADLMRVSRVGVPQNTPGLPIVNVGAVENGGGGGGDTTQRQVFQYIAEGTEGTTFTVPLPTQWISTTEVPTYNVQMTFGGPDTVAFKQGRPLKVSFQLTEFDVEMNVAPEAGEILMFTVEERTDV